MADLFYHTGRRYKSLLREAFGLAVDKQVDIMADHWHRVKCDDITPEEALETILVPGAHHVFILRYNTYGEKMPGTGTAPVYCQSGGCTMNRKHDVFLFMHLTMEDAETLIGKYKLKPMT